MERKYAFLIIVGLLFGVVLGIYFGEAIEKPWLGLAFGAFGGVFLGWFGAIIAQQENNKKHKK